MRIALIAFVSLSVLLLAAPNRGGFDHIGNFNFKVEIDGIALNMTSIVAFSDGAVFLERDSFSTAVEDVFQRAVRDRDEARANAFGALSNALVEEDRAIALTGRNPYTAFEGLDFELRDLSRAD